MGDAIFMVIIVAFFGVAWLLVKGCERIMGPALELVDTDLDESEPEADLSKDRVA